MPRAPRPEDLYRFRIPLEPRLMPSGASVVFTLKTTAPSFDGYRHAIWSVPADGSGRPRQLTLGAKNDAHARPSPDGRVLAFLSDRRLATEDAPPKGPPGRREDGVQVHLLPLDGGEARRLTDLPRGVDGFAWSPDGRRLVVCSTSLAPTLEADARRRGLLPAVAPGDPPRSDYRYLDRLGYLENGRGYIDDQVSHLWLIDAETGDSRQLTVGKSSETQPAWSPDGRRIAFVADRSGDSDISTRPMVWVVDADSGDVLRITGGDAWFGSPAWIDDRTVAVLGHRFPARAGSRADVWLFAADGSESGPAAGRDLSARHDLMPGSVMSSDLQPGEEPRLIPFADGQALLFLAPVRGAYELWRISTADGEVERLTDERAYLSSFDAVPLPGGGIRVAAIQSSPVEPGDVVALELTDSASGRARGTAPGRVRASSPPHGAPAGTLGGASRSCRLTELNADVMAEVDLIAPEERWISVDGREIQGWLYPASLADGRPAPLVLEIHGGPHSLYGWAPMWEWQVLLGAGMSVYACNPRGSEGYGQDFDAANYRDWGDGPMRDVLAGVDALVGEGCADPGRLGITGGSYGGYLTNWILAKDRRFRAAVTCRSVTDLTSLMLGGDIQSGDWARMEFGVAPWEDVGYYRSISPIAYAADIHTPLLIQHSESDLRTPIGQADALFTVLRSLGRPVRFMRVPAETHELTRSGTPFRRVENLGRIRDWFVHFLVEGKRGMPPLPRERAGR